MQKLLLTLLPLLTIGCATTHAIRPSSADHIPAAATGVLYSYELVSEDPWIHENGCELRMINRTDQTRYALPLKPGRSLIWFEAPVGQYIRQELYCYRGRHWAFAEETPLVVSPSKVSVSALYSYRTIDTSSDLGTSVGKADVLRSQLLDVYLKNPAPSRKTWVSAYTGQPIVEAILKKERRSSWRFSAPDRHKVELSEADQMPGMDCFAAELRSNPLLLGTHEVVATYDAKQNTGLTHSQDEHLFSKTFLGCIEEALKAYAPRDAGQLQVKLIY